MTSTLQRLLCLAAACAVFLPLAATADDDSGNPDWFPGEFSANVAITSDYPFRGISQTDEEAAIQGGIDWSASVTEQVSVFLGTWASNVDFSDGDQGQTEFDFYGGVSLAVGDFSADLTAIYYEYPGANNGLDYDYWEFGPSFGYDAGVASVSVGYLWSPDFFAASNDAHALSGGVEIPLPEGILPSWIGFTASGNIGGQWIVDNAAFGAKDYAFWDAGGTISIFGLDVDLRYFDTSIRNDNDCFGGTDYCDPRFVATVSKSF